MKQKHSTQNNLLVEQGRKAETQNNTLLTDLQGHSCHPSLVDEIIQLC